MIMKKETVAKPTRKEARAKKASAAALKNNDATEVSVETPEVTETPVETPEVTEAPVVIETPVSTEAPTETPTEAPIEKKEEIKVKRDNPAIVMVTSSLRYIHKKGPLGILTDNHDCKTLCNFIGEAVQSKDGLESIDEAISDIFGTGGLNVTEIMPMYKKYTGPADTISTTAYIIEMLNGVDSKIPHILDEETIKTLEEYYIG